MIQDTHNWITIHDVARMNGWKLGDVAAMQIGDRVRRSWEWAVKTAPIKDLRTKKAGTGSHCFALYPPEWKERIERHIRAFNPQADEQGSLF